MNSSSPTGFPAIEVRPYWCFISYRHADNKEEGRQWATWLHQALETYEVPGDLVGTQNERGEIIPERIFPVFRDEDELPANADLSTPIYSALDKSKYLVVICSPQAVESTHVADEIRYFKKSGRENRVLAAMVEGEPNASWDLGKQSHGFRPDQECFPEPLRHRVNTDGVILEARTEPVAADFRLSDGSKGWTSSEAYRQALKRTNGVDSRTIATEVEIYRKKNELMKLKIIAGVLGLSLGTLTKRDVAYQLALAKKRSRVLRTWLVGVWLLAIAAVAFAYLAWLQKKKQEDTFARSDYQEAKSLIETGEPLRALPYLSRSLRTKPVDNPAAALAFGCSQLIPMPELVLKGSEASFSPDGTKLLLFEEGEYRVVSSEDGKVISHFQFFPGLERPFQTPRFSRDGNHILIGDAVVDANNGRIASRLPAGLKTDQDGTFSSSPNGDKMLNSAHWVTQLWTTAPVGSSAITLMNSERIYNCDFNLDGKMFVTVSHRSVKVWNSDSGKLVSSIVTQEPIRCAKFNEAGTAYLTLALSGDEVCLNDSVTGATTRTFAANSASLAALSPNGLMLALAEGNTLRVLKEDFPIAIIQPDAGCLITTYGDLKTSPNVKLLPWGELDISTSAKEDTNPQYFLRYVDEDQDSSLKRIRFQTYKPSDFQSGSIIYTSISRIRVASIKHIT
jgi:hypothetical protein